MPILTINGFPIEIRKTGGDDMPEIDDSPQIIQRAVNGEIFVDETNDKRRWNAFRTVMLPLTEAQALRDLLRVGRNGHAWPFDADTFSSKGRDVAGGTIAQEGANPKFGDGNADVTGAPQNVGPVGSIHTVAAWYFTGVFYQHEILRSDGAKWVDAVRDDGATLHIDTSGGFMRFTDNADYDDAVIFDFEILDEWGDNWEQLQAFSLLPDLIVSGDFVSGESVTVLARNVRLVQMEANLEGTFQSVGVVIFDLQEA